jgi:diaminopimelate decarboxylase
MSAPKKSQKIGLVGKFCESGDIIVKETYIDAQLEDIIAIFGTGAYNYSMSSNYNRTARPACILVKNGQAEIIIERESLEDLIRQDRIPARFMLESIGYKQTEKLR